jgi:predicted nucleic acid-binding protein
VSGPRLVLDASVVLAALLSPTRRSASCLLVEAIGTAEVRVVKSDPSDDVYLGTALPGRTTYLATFDRRHLLPLDPWRGVRVLAPGDVLRGLRRRG